MANRKAAEALVYERYNDLDPSGKNTEIIKSFFSAMTDEEFDNYVKAIKNGEDYLSVVMDNLNGSAITTVNNLKVAEKWGYKFYQKAWLTDAATGKVFQSGPEYLFIHLPLRRQIQTLVHKISVPEDNKHVDELTDQPTGVSKGSSISFPETLALYAQGFRTGILECIKFRGGDLPLMNAMDKKIHETGGVNISAMSGGNTRVKSTVTLGVLLKGAHLDNNF